MASPARPTLGAVWWVICLQSGLGSVTVGAAGCRRSRGGGSLGLSLLVGAAVGGPPTVGSRGGGGSGALVALVRRRWVVPLTGGRRVPLGGARRPGNTTEYRVFTVLYDPNHDLRSMLIMLL